MLPENGNRPGEGAAISVGKASNATELTPHANITQATLAIRTPDSAREGVGRARPRLYCWSAAASGPSMMSAFAAIDYATHVFSPTAQEVARFLRSIGVGANNDTVLLLATLDRRFPSLSLHDLHEATVLVEALTLETRGNA